MNIKDIEKWFIGGTLVLPLVGIYIIVSSLGWSWANVIIGFILGMAFCFLWLLVCDFLYRKIM